MSKLNYETERYTVEKYVVYCQVLFSEVRDEEFFFEDDAIDYIASCEYPQDFRYQVEEVEQEEIILVVPPNDYD